jgi:flagellar FliL protein
MAADGDKAKAPGKKGIIIVMAALTFIALGAGALLGKLLVGRLRPPPPPATAATAAPALPYASETAVKELPPVVTNLRDGRRSIRIQVAIVYVKKDVPDPTMLSVQVGDDLVAFLKTLSLPQLQGASGLQNLREDLNERAKIRSQGSVREVIIETLVTG